MYVSRSSYKLYHHYNDTNKPYPNDPVNTDPAPIFNAGDDAADHCNILAHCEYAHRRFKDVTSMNTALVDCLLARITEPYKAKYMLKRYINQS